MTQTTPETEPKIPAHEELFLEYRAQTLDNIHMGYLAMIDENDRLIFSVGDPNADVYLRSSAKPIQALPVLSRNLDTKFGLTPEESAIFSASHAAQPHHIAALESIYAKAGLKEDDLIVKPTVPGDQDARYAARAAGAPLRKFNHNCSGKHAGILMLQRELGGDLADYWKPESVAQQEILRVISLVSTEPVERIHIGVDGCGVPVFAMPIAKMALAFRNLVTPERIPDETIADAAVRYLPRLHAYPHMISGYGRICTLLNGDDNLIAKGGAAGVYGLALKREKIGIAFKMTSGESTIWPLVVHHVLKCLNGASQDTLTGLLKMMSYELTNDNDRTVGEFRLSAALARLNQIS